MPRIEGVSNLVQKLAYRAKGTKRSFTINVGYSAPYAIFVHENLQASHPTGQAKFLEQPMRQMQPQLVSNIKRWMKGGATQEEAMKREAFRLMQASQALCPVDTGFLRASAFNVVRQ
jgi:hypothetical protein